MEDDADVFGLVQLIFGDKIMDTEEIKERYPLFPPCLLSTAFFQSLMEVLSVRQMILVNRWHKFFDTCSLKMLSSHEKYVQHIMYACLKEKECNQNIFDSFISVCALVIMLSNETLRKTGLNFCALNPFIIMIFYRNMLKDVFCRRGGFQQLVEYISSHRYLRYLSWKRQGKSFVIPHALVNDMSRDLFEKFQKEIKRERSFQKVINLIEVENNEKSSSLATETLQTTDVKLPTLPIYDDLVITLVEYRKKKKSEIFERKEKSEIIGRMEKSEEATKFEALEMFSQGYPSLNLDSKTSYIPKQKESEVRCENIDHESEARCENIDHESEARCANIDPESEARCENIVQAVIIYNNSKTSAHGNTNNLILEEADGILKHLKDTVVSLIEVLNEYDNE